MQWYKRAAKQGLDEAQYNLGYIFESGEVVPKNLKKAIEFYRKAAEQGHIKAQNRLFDLGYIKRGLLFTISDIY